MAFTADFFDALGAWQRGWREMQDERIKRAEALKAEAIKLPVTFRSVENSCYRKRFLYPKDLPSLLGSGKIADGLASWTLNPEFADLFKGLERANAVTAAIFKHDPKPSEIVLSIPALWASQDFRDAAAKYEAHGGKEAKAVCGIRDTQGEVILEAELHREEIVAFSGKSSPFEELCEAAGIAEDDHDNAWNLLLELEKQPEVPRYLRKEAVERVLMKVQARIEG